MRATPQEKARLQQLTRHLGFGSLAHFFRRTMETLFEQVDSGQEIHWPLRFVTKKEETILNQTASPRKPEQRKKS